MKKIILNSGITISLVEWQEDLHITPDRLSEHLGVNEVAYNNEIIITAPIIEAFEYIRSDWKKPIHINSGYRTIEKQQQLRAAGYRAAITSPHVYGLALDLDTSSSNETRKLLQTIRIVRDHLAPWMRIGWKKYLADNMTFIHIDAAPFFYGPGRIWETQDAPPAWRIPGLEW